MLTSESFSGSDLEKIQSLPQVFKLTAIFYVIIAIPISLLCGFFGLTKNGFGYWNIVMATFIFLMILFIFYQSYKYFLYKKDLKNQIKLVGTVIITSKSAKKGNNIIFTDSKTLKKIDVNSKDIFDRLSVGDKVNIEISKFSKEILSLKKDNVELKNGS